MPPNLIQEFGDEYPVQDRADEGVTTCRVTAFSGETRGEGNHSVVARLALPALPNGALTPAPARPYSGCMPQDNTRELLEQELSRLENRIVELTAVCAKLRRDNHSLSERLESLSTERSGLLAKNEHVRGRVDAIISRLKSLEESA